MCVWVSISPGSTVTSAGRLMTVAPAGALPPLVTLSILLPLITTSTLCRTWFATPSIRLAAWMAITFSVAGVPFDGFAVCAVAVVTRVEANSRITNRMALRLNISELLPSSDQAHYKYALKPECAMALQVSLWILQGQSARRCEVTKLPANSDDTFRQDERRSS